MFWLKTVCFLCLYSFVISDPQLMSLSSKNTCILNVVQSFVKQKTCDHLDDNSKSYLALSMTNCLMIQMGRNQIICKTVSNCPNLKGQSWSTFTTFYAHIDNLCHFYWDIAKAEKADQMVSALVNSAENTQKTLKQNNQNTKEIINLQNNLKLQIIASLTSQQQMKKIIDTSSLAITSLTRNLQNSLQKIHEQIGSHYAIISKVLAGINQILDSISIFQQYFVSELTSIKGMIYFVCLVIFLAILCAWSIRVRMRRNQCLLLILVNIFSQYFLIQPISFILSVESLRIGFLIIMALLIFSTNLTPSNKIQKLLEQKLTTDRLKRILAKAINSKMKSITQQNLPNKQIDQ